MHWKYSVQKDDLVRFKYDPETAEEYERSRGKNWDDDRVQVAEGTVRGVITPEYLKEMDNPTFDDLDDMNDLKVVVKSGMIEVVIPLGDVKKRFKKAEEREDEVTQLGEDLRLSGQLS